MPCRSCSAPSRASTHRAGSRLMSPTRQRLALVRLGGYALSALAFALALARPPVPSLLYSGNTVAVAILGLALYAASLRNERHPAFLYMAVGAVVAGRLGAHYFVADRLHAIEEAVRQLLRYPDHLPIAVPGNPRPDPQHGTRLVIALVHQELG